MKLVSVCRDDEDEANAAEKKGDMSNFYGNLMTKNVAFGGTRYVHVSCCNSKHRSPSDSQQAQIRHMHGLQLQ